MFYAVDIYACKLFNILLLRQMYKYNLRDNQYYHTDEMRMVALTVWRRDNSFFYVLYGCRETFGV